MSAVPIRPASTVLVFKKDADAFSVFMVKRHHQSGFMAGAHVFPGGRVDDDDRDVPVLDDDRAACAQHWDDDLSLDNAAAHAAAAVRELCEETGLLLAKTAAGEPASPDVAADMFAAMKAGESFAEHLRRRALFADLARLSPFAWWLTPEAEPKRYDTRFFVCEAPAGQRGDIDGTEVVQWDWFSPEAALSAYAEKQIALAPPTLVSLEDLRGVQNLEDIRRRVPRPVRKICPEIRTDADGRLELTLPGHQAHPESEPIWAGVRNRVLMDKNGRFLSSWAD